MKQILFLLISFSFIFGYANATQYDDFIKNNINSFSEFNLDNGLKVVLKKNDFNNINSLSILFKGGSSIIKRDKAGLEEALLSLLQYESKNFSEIIKRQVLHKTSSKIESNVYFDYSLYHLTTIDKYFDETFNLYIDLLINPTFNQKYFKEVITNMKNDLKTRLSDGNKRVSYHMNLTYLKKHKYASGIQTLKTLSNLKLSDLKRFYEKNINASRIVVFAVGNFDESELKKKLNKTLGKIKKGTYKEPKLSPAKANQKLLVLSPLKTLKGKNSHLRGDFESIPPTHKDYYALNLAFDLLGEINKDNIRTKRGLTYGVSGFTRGFKSNYSSLILYRTSDPVQAFKLINKGINILKSGKCLSPSINSSAAGKGGIGRSTANPQKTSYVPISDALDFYKLSFITSYFNYLQSNKQISYNMIGSYVSTGDYKDYLYIPQKVNKITPEDIVNATKNFISRPVKIWAVSANPKYIKKIKKSYKLFAPKTITVK